MTEGSISKRIVKFAIPVFLGGLFQQLYNVADAIVVGNFVGEEALAAVSSSGSLIFLIVGFVHGLFVGAGVVIARYFGANSPDKVQKAVHTTLAFGLCMGVLLTAVGVLLSPLLLTWMGTPDNVFGVSVLYFRIYFAGAVGFVMYSTANGIYQAVGDSRHPLYYLIISSVINIVLDLLFVAVFDFGVAGAAAATLIGQFVSAAISIIKLTRVSGAHRVTLKNIRIHRSVLGEIVRLGLPTGVQNSVIGFANVLVQSKINLFGSDAMAGCGSYFKAEGFAFLPITAFSLAITTFVSQNIGAEKYDRVRRGARFGVVGGVLLSAVIGLLMTAFAPYIVRLFNSSPEVIKYGVMQMRTEAFFYALLAFSHCVAGVLRGAGKSTFPMVVMLVCWCFIRVVYITLAVKYVPNIRMVFWAYPITWSLSSGAFAVLFMRLDRSWRKIVNKYSRNSEIPVEV